MEKQIEMDVKVDYRKIIFCISAVAQLKLTNELASI